MKTHEITEADVIAFMQSKQAELRAATGMQYSSISIYVDAHTSAVSWQSYSDGGEHINRLTVAEAISAQVRLTSPAVRAANARDKAAKLLAQAEALEAAQ